ncbi:MAG: FeoB-associated Cys-rich membrane protein [Sphaerochaetaceae bacterium]|jgi:hypothetical protein
MSPIVANIIVAVVIVALLAVAICIVHRQKKRDRADNAPSCNEKYRFNGCAGCPYAGHCDKKR